MASSIHFTRAQGAHDPQVASAGGIPRASRQRREFGPPRDPPPPRPQSPRPPVALRARLLTSRKGTHANADGVTEPRPCSPARLRGFAVGVSALGLWPAMEEPRVSQSPPSSSGSCGILFKKLN